VIDDIADEDWPLADKHRLLDDWCAEIGRLYDGRPVSAIGQALALPVMRYKLPRTEFLMLIEGMEMDADGPMVAPPLTRLRAYTRRVAGAVGMLSMRVFGAWTGPQSERAALALGDAFQLTNILRDVEEDAAIGRLYLPREALEAAGVPTDDPMAAARHPELWRACAEVGRLARADFTAARVAMASHRRLALAPALLMTGVYEGYLASMEARGFRRGGGPVRLSKAAKLWRGLVCLAGPIAPRP
jgi:phytoene synthase